MLHKKINKKHLIAIGITVLFLSCGFIYKLSVLRFGESCRDVGLSIAYYFTELFTTLFGGKNKVTTSVTQVSAQLNMDTAFPLLWDDFTEKMSLYWQKLFTAENFGNYIGVISQWLVVVFIGFLFVAPIFISIYFLCKKIMLSGNEKAPSHDSKPLKIFRKAERKIKPAKLKIADYFAWLKYQRIYLKIWLVIWLLFTNILSIIFETVAFAVYFLSSFDMLHIYLQIYKLSLDVAYMLNTMPAIVWVIVACIIINRWRRKIGISRLRRNENRNKGFINSLNLVLMITGSMGSKKTTTLTDFLLSQEAMFRDKALELMQENDIKFPAFSWAQFEAELCQEMSAHKVYNLTTCKKWVRERQREFEFEPAKEKIFGYDYALYPIQYDTELKTESLFDVLETYAQLYFVYVVQSSLITANYSVRTDNSFETEGHFPFWDTDFFDRSADDRKKSRCSHILDFDTLRLGRKLNEENKNVFEFGIIGITEIGKERGNMIELQGIEKAADEANQKNDLFNYSLKMARHKATIDNFPFVRFYTDEQRASSWGADGKELCTLINIADVADEILAMPFYFVEELLHDVVFGKFIKLYYDYRYKRSDNILTVYLLKKFTAWLHSKNTAVHDRFGYYRSVVETRAGTMDGEVVRHKYYLAKKKIYADRFSTDCYSEILTAEAATTNLGIEDMPSYAGTKPTVQEFEQQNSFFIRELMRIVNLADDSAETDGEFNKLFTQAKKEVDYAKIVADAYKAYKKDAAKRCIADIENRKKTQ